jgi:hypothetical protein
VAEFRYRPTACKKTYRKVVRKNIAVEKGAQVLFDRVVYFFYYPGQDDARTNPTRQRGNPSLARRAREDLSRRGNNQCLILEHALVDAIRPGEDSAGKVLQVGETLLAQELDGLLAAHAAFTVDDDLAVAVQLAMALRQCR